MNCRKNSKCRFCLAAVIVVCGVLFVDCPGVLGQFQLGGGSQTMVKRQLVSRIDAELSPLSRVLKLAPDQSTLLRQAVVGSVHRYVDTLAPDELKQTLLSADLPAEINAKLKESALKLVKEDDWLRYEQDKRLRAAFAEGVSRNAVLVTLNRELALTDAQQLAVDAILKKHWIAAWSSYCSQFGHQGNLGSLQGIVKALPAQELQASLSPAQWSAISLPTGPPFQVMLGRGPDDPDLDRKKEAYSQDQHQQASQCVQLQVEHITSICKLQPSQVSNLSSVGNEVSRELTESRVAALEALQRAKRGEVNPKAMQAVSVSNSIQLLHYQPWRDAIRKELTAEQSQALQASESSSRVMVRDSLLGQLVIETGRLQGLTGRQQVDLMKLLRAKTTPELAGREFRMLGLIAAIEDESFDAILDADQWQPFKATLVRQQAMVEASERK